VSLLDKAFEEPEGSDLPDDTPLEDRAGLALTFAVRYGWIDGAHHKDWVIDQMCRALLGPDYEAMVDRACGEDGDWPEGIAP